MAVSAWAGNGPIDFTFYSSSDNHRTDTSLFFRFLGGVGRMSVIIAASATANVVFATVMVPYNDESLHSVDYRSTPPFALSNSPMDMDILWPRSSFPGYQAQAGGMLYDAACQMWEWHIYATGQRNKKKISGQTLDQSGAPIAGVTVKLINVASGVIVDTQVSDAGGNYTLSDPNNVACQVIAYLAGAPDTAGISVNTLTGV